MVGVKNIAQKSRTPRTPMYLGTPSILVDTDKGPAREVGWGTASGVVLTRGLRQLGWRYVVQDLLTGEWSDLLESKGAAQHYVDSACGRLHSLNVGRARIAERAAKWRLFFWMPRIISERSLLRAGIDRTSVRYI